MSKFNADVPRTNGRDHGSATGAEVPNKKSLAAGGPDAVTTVTTIGAVGVVAALIDVALIPGLIIGVAAAFAPQYVPKLGERLEPLFDSTVKGAVKLTRKARSVVAEAQERVDDIAAEVDAETAAKAESTDVVS